MVLNSPELMGPKEDIFSARCGMDLQLLRNWGLASDITYPLPNEGK